MSSPNHFHVLFSFSIIVGLLLIFSPAPLATHARLAVPETNSAPVAVDDSFTVHGQRQLTPLTNDYDPDNDSFSLYSFTQPQHGGILTGTSTTYTYAAASGYVGSDSFTYTVRDSAGNFASAVINITVVNQAPIAEDDYYSIHGQLLITPAQNDHDPENDGVSFQAISTQPQHGQLIPYNTGVYTYVATYGYVGSDSFTYTIADGYGAVATGTVHIEVVNQSPIAEDDYYSIHGQLLITPAQNDHDPENDGATFQAISTQPQHGQLIPYNTGVYTYIATYGYVGSDSFTYTIADGYGAVATGTVHIEVVNQSPIAIPDFYVWKWGLHLIPAQNDIDPESDGVTLQNITSQPQHGTLDGWGPGIYLYWPSAGFSGFDSFTYTVVDGYGAVSSGTVYIFVIGSSTMSLPPHSCACPDDPSGHSGFNPETGGLRSTSTSAGGRTGPQANDPVNLATGRETYTPESDLSIYNPSGPAVNWQRSYVADQALADSQGYGSPGLSRGWVHSYDLSIQGTSGSWGALKLIYPNGAQETLTPQLSGGQPTGAFTTSAGVPYIVTGVAGTPTGTWQSVTVTWKDQTQWKFTLLSGTTYALTQLTNRTGQSLNFTWNSSRALTQIADATSSAVLLSLAYNSNGKLLTATDAYSRQIVYAFSSVTGTAESMLQTVSQVVTSGTSNPPAHWSYTYDVNKGQQLHTITVPSPTGTGTSTATINYDSTGRVSSLVDANGNQRVYTYNSGTTQVQVKDAANNVALSWTQKFNAASLNTGITDAASHGSAIAYTDSANPLKPTTVTDRNNHSTSYTYDSFGNIITMTSPRSVTTTYSWDYTNFPMGRLTSVQEESKPATTITYYEPSGLIHTITRPEPNNGAGSTTTSFTYNSLGNVLTAVAPGNNSTSTITTTYNYTTDGGYSQSAKIGQPLTVTDNLNHTTHFRYDLQGRNTSVTDALGNETDFTYNLIGQADTSTYPATGQTGSGHNHTTNSYLYVGGPLTAVSSFDESNTQVRQINYGYGSEGELLSLLGSTEPVTRTYDPLYRPKTLKDGNNNTTTYAYNSIGQLASITMPGSEVTQFTSYDNNGNLLQRVDGNNVTTNYVYNDAESLLTDIQYPATTSLNVHFAYDSSGKRSSMTDATGSQSYAYGNLDELLSVSTTYTGLSAKTISYTYYPDGSRESMTTPAGTFNYSYDSAGRPASMTNPFSETTEWSYQDNNWLATQTLANGAVATYTQNGLGQVTELLNQIGSTTISDYTLGYDGAGNRSSVTVANIGTSTLNGSGTFTYDTKNQLLEELSTRHGGFTNDFDFDSAGNSTSFKGVTKSFNSNNQQTGSGFTYDSNGNPTAYNGVSLTFDPENRLTSHGTSLTAGYRGDGLRGWKQVSSGTTYFLYDGTNPVIELTSSGGVLATNSFSPRGLVSRRVSTVSVLYSFDSEGNVAERTDTSASVLSDHFFDAHGVNVAGSLTEPFGYRAQFGYYTDVETGLQLLTNRYYDPATGRFLTRDPISYRGGINLYSYVQNNSTNFIDPLGLEMYSAQQFEKVPFKGLPPLGGGGSPIIIAGTVAVLDGPEPGPMDVFAAGYLIWACIVATSPAMNPALPQSKPITLSPPWTPNPRTDRDRERQCEIQYENDSSVCRILPDPGARARCWASASDRLAMCLRGYPQPPLITE
jgi:RHS repeat-associated protein